MLILSILGCDFCISPIVSVPDTEGQKETLQVNQCFKEKALPAEGALAGTEASYHTISYTLLAFRSSTIRGGHMQGKGHEVMWHAMQHFSLLLHRRSVTATTDEDVSVQHWIITCALLSNSTVQNVHFIKYNFTYALYNIFLLNAPWELP